MVLSETEQVINTIKTSQHILITFNKDYSVDAVASALALYSVLVKLGKLVDIASADFARLKTLDFLDQSENIKPDVSNLEKFVICLDTAGKQIEEFSYNVEGDKLKIFITPKNGSFNQNQVTTSNTDYKYDLIITLDTPDLESLGKIYQQHTEFFYNTPVINIDSNPENEHYGQINLVNINAVASAEIIFNLINAIDKSLWDKKIATNILAGLITKTKSFKTSNVTPKTLEIAGQLLAAEADRDLIIKKIYRSRSLSTLNLWGRALARLKSFDGNKLVWTLITEHDFLEAKTGAQELPEVVDELVSFIPGVEIVVLIYQQGSNVCVLLNTIKNHNALYLAGAFETKGNKNLVEFCLPNSNLVEAEKEVIAKIKEKLGQIN
ncbi:MAG: DHH family phosphoesterase [Candidatus Buchananbacteria bacterium]